MVPEVRERARHAREMRASAGTCVGCGQPASAGSGTDLRTHDTDASRNCRCCKSLEPSRRLRETTGPQPPSAFRIAFRRQR